MFLCGGFYFWVWGGGIVVLRFLCLRKGLSFDGFEFESVA